MASIISPVVIAVPASLRTLAAASRQLIFFGSFAVFAFRFLLVPTPSAGVASVGGVIAAGEGGDSVVGTGWSGDTFVAVSAAGDVSVVGASPTLAFALPPLDRRIGITLGRIASGLLVVVFFLLMVHLRGSWFWLHIATMRCVNVTVSYLDVRQTARPAGEGFSVFPQLSSTRNM